MSKLSQTPVLLLILFQLVASKPAGYPNQGLQQIVNGEICDIELFPFAVQYYQKAQNQEPSRCGGSLLTYQWVLSAAHCYHTGRTIVETTVVAGTSLLHIRVYKSEGLVRKVILEVPHPDYIIVNKIYRNDILLAKVETPFPQDNAWIKPVKLPPTGFTTKAKVAVVMGWGLQTPIRIHDWLVGLFPEYFHDVDSEDKPIQYENNLMCVNVPVSQYYECQRYLPKIFDLLPTHICTKPDEQKGPCKGDSGGPLAIKNIIIGIVSLGFGCGQHAQYIYTRVDKYYDFMSEHVEDLVIPESKHFLDLNNKRSNDSSRDISKAVADTKPSVLLLVLPEMWMILAVVFY